MIERRLSQALQDKSGTGKAIILTGAQQQKEIDYLEEKDGRLAAYEFKWNPSARNRAPRQFTNAYPESGFSVIHPGNFEDFLLP